MEIRDWINFFTTSSYGFCYFASIMETLSKHITGNAVVAKIARNSLEIASNKVLFRFVSVSEDDVENIEH